MPEIGFKRQSLNHLHTTSMRTVKIIIIISLAHPHGLLWLVLWDSIISLSTPLLPFPFFLILIYFNQAVFGGKKLQQKRNLFLEIATFADLSSQNCETLSLFSNYIRTRNQILESHYYRLCFIFV